MTIFITLPQGHLLAVFRAFISISSGWVLLGKELIMVFLLVSVCCDTAQASVFLLVSVCCFLLVSVCCDTAQASVFLLVSV